FELLQGGATNLNYRLRVDGLTDEFVLRIYIRDPSACQKEVDIHKRVDGHLPVPEVLYANTAGDEGIPPFLLKRYVEGATFQEIKHGGDRSDTGGASYAVGKILGELQALRIPGTAASPAGVEPPLAGKSAPMPELLDKCLQSPVVERRLGITEKDRLGTYLYKWKPRLMTLDEKDSLVHGDFNARNTLLKARDGGWTVTAILDWELAFSGSPLWDAARFICYENQSRPLREPHFSRGFVEGGGALPDDWTEFSRAINLLGATEALSHKDMPPIFVSELVDLVVGTVATSL
ncbi:MAG TPA: aminoglycoside phosphotransferase family protein, partial [Blastocatellia bacterium]|nr:aminoglycoside phosphotransferase family protein [Blastocatellia bacterium]